MARFWVIGGEYASTRFDEPAAPGAEQRHGPFASYEDAKAEWARRSWANVDNAHARFRIEEEAAPAAASEWWVVGGTYETTEFQAPAGGQEGWHGPFRSREAAMDEWRRLAWSTVDDALTRYRLEQRRAGEAPPDQSAR
jgi:hypothetical protein